MNSYIYEWGANPVRFTLCPKCHSLNFWTHFILPVNTMHLSVRATSASANPVTCTGLKQNLLHAQHSDMHMCFVLLTVRGDVEGLCLRISRAVFKGSSWAAKATCVGHKQYFESLVQHIWKQFYKRRQWRDPRENRCWSDPFPPANQDSGEIFCKIRKCQSLQVSGNKRSWRILIFTRWSDV